MSGIGRHFKSCRYVNYQLPSLLEHFSFCYRARQHDPSRNGRRSRATLLTSMSNTHVESGRQVVNAERLHSVSSSNENDDVTTTIHSSASASSRNVNGIKTRVSQSLGVPIVDRFNTEDVLVSKNKTENVCIFNDSLKGYEDHHSAHRNELGGNKLETKLTVKLTDEVGQKHATKARERRRESRRSEDVRAHTGTLNILVKPAPVEHDFSRFTHVEEKAQPIILARHLMFLTERELATLHRRFCRR